MKTEEYSKRTVGTSLEDLLLQKNINLTEHSQYEFRIKELEQKINTLEEKNETLTNELNRQKSLIQKMEAEKISVANSLFEKAVRELKNENPVDAIGSLRAVLIYEPENTKAMINLAVVYAELGFEERAVEILHSCRIFLTHNKIPLGTACL
ncbi:MAG: hypothetical protein GY795_33100 [Desulfobacterales bacterium]|nr:hypothetical protein [Desulfobacterales bacterium]